MFTQNTTESLNLVAYSYGMNFLHEGDGNRHFRGRASLQHGTLAARGEGHRRKARLYVSRRGTAA